MAFPVSTSMNVNVILACVTTFQILSALIEPLDIAPAISTLVCVIHKASTLFRVNQHAVVKSAQQAITGTVHCKPV